MIIDLHVHTNHPFYPAESTPTAIIKRMNRDGIDVSVVSPLDGAVPAPGKDFRSINDNVSAASKEHPDKLIGFGWINYLMKPEVTTKEVRRAVQKQGLVGVEFTPELLMCALSHPNIPPILETAMSLEVPVRIHAGREPYAQPALIGDLADSFPNETIIIGELMDPYLWPDAIIVAKTHENVFLEITNTPSKLIEEAVKKIGAGRILFGSCAPIMRPKAVIDHIGLLDVSEEDKARILGENARKMLKMES